MSSVNLEGLEIKEATPSIAPSIYESLPYTKKWRILIALLIGVAIIGVCILVFYLSAEAKKTDDAEILNEKGKLSILATDEIYKSWRDNDDEECLISLRDSCPEDYGPKPVILLVLGGLRIDQVSEIPALQEFVKCGSSAKSLVPSYPSFDYPNLYSIATGLYPESHGIISNEMFDYELQRNFSIDSPNSFTVNWWGGEPIWNTVGKAGKRSATYLWPGSNVQIQGRYPTYWQKDKVDFITRIKKIVDWVDLPKEERPQLIMAYYEQPVKTSQEFGPFSPKTVKELAAINLGLDELMTILDDEDLINCVDIIVASDHGVAASACDDSIYIDELVDEEIPGRLYTGTVGRIDFLEDADKETVHRITQKLKCTESSLRALEKNEVPIRYHYTSNPRIGDVVLDARSGARIATEKEDKCLDGEFGYDILSRSMQGVFVAHGPSFRIGASTDSYRNVEIYNLLNHLVDVEPAPNNGTRDSLLHLLRSSLVSDSLYEKPDVSYLKESLKSFPSRPNNAVLGKYSDVDVNSVSCPCEQKTQLSPTHVETVEEASSVADVESSHLLASTTQKSSTTSSSSTTESTTEVPKTSPSSSSTSSSTTEHSMDSAEIEVTSPSLEEVHSASSRALDSEVVLPDTVDISNATKESGLDRPVLDLTDLIENYDESALNSTLEGIHYNVDNATIVSENDSDSEVIETTEKNTTFIPKLPEPRQIAEIILSHEDIKKAQENAEVVTEVIFSDTAFENANDTISDGGILQESILPSEEEEEEEEALLMESLREQQHPIIFEHNNNNDTNEELISDTTTLRYVNSEEISITVTDSLNADDMKEMHTESSYIKDSIGLETHSEKQNNTAYVEDLILENIDALNIENAVENVDIEHTTEMQKGILEIPVLSEHVNSDYISNSESQVEHYEEHTLAENNDGQETVTTHIKPLHDIDMANEHEEQEVFTTEITSIHGEDTIAEGASHISEITIAHNKSHSKLEQETALEIGAEEIVNIPETSTSIFESGSKKLEIQAIYDPNEHIKIPETSTPTLISKSEKLEALEILDPKENIETSTLSLELSSEKTNVQEVVDAKENIAIPEPSTSTLRSTSEKLEIQPVLDILETSTPTSESIKEEIEILPIPDSLKSMSLVKESSEETKDMQVLLKQHCPWGFPSYSAPEVSSDTLNILPHSSHIIGFPESLSLGVWTSFTLIKNKLEELHKARPAVPEGVYVSPEEKRSKMPVGCWISDSRLQRSSSDQCSRTLQTDLYNAKNVSLRQLYPEDLEFPDILNKEGYLLSNLAPVMKGYEEGPRSVMVRALKKWAKQKGPINVVHGPVFDHNNDGKRDNTLILWDTVKPLIPSGYYFVVTLCNETKESESSSEEEHNEVPQVESLEACPMANLNVYSFLFPNTPENDMCLLSPREYLQYYMASLADIEEVTSIYFFRNMDYKNKVQIRARQPLRTPAI